MWMKVDDGLHAHRKTRAVTKSHPDKRRDAAAMGLWVLAGSWAAQNGTDGWVPEDELDRWDDDAEDLAKRLVRAGYWWPVQRDGEPGYGFNDWHDYNDPADFASKAGTYGNHVRWHVNEGRVEPECEHCPKEPDDPDDTPEDRGDIAPESGGESGAISGGESRNVSGAIALPEPEPDPIPNPKNLSSPVASATADPKPPRPDVERLCKQLADHIERNGAKRPEITQGWRDAARLMLDRDNRPEAHAAWLIDWCQKDEFWHTNILSMPKFRAKYDQLLLKSKPQRLQMDSYPENGTREEQDAWLARHPAPARSW